MKTVRFKSIESFILLFFVIRLYGIWFPPLETWHSWRQTLTNMIARNMNEGNFSLLYPVVDMGGERTGIIGSEFPLYQSIIAVFNQIFGYEHWYGRLISLIVASIATWCFHKIVERFFSTRIAWYGTIIFLSSLWFAFSRKSMPDTFAVSLVLIGIYWIIRFVDEKKIWKLIIGTVFLTFGGLCKIPAIFLFALYIPFALNKSILYKPKIQIAIGLVIACINIGLWYFYWVPFLVNNYHIQLFFPKGIVEGLGEIQAHWSDFFLQFYFGALRSYIVWIGLITGIIFLFYKINRRIAIGFFVLTFVFVLFSLKTGAVFPTHNYYALPFSPVLATIAAIGLQRFKPKTAIILVILIAIEGIGNQLSDFRIKDELRYKLDLARQVDLIVPKGEKIIIASGASPEAMYWCHRKGWSIEREQFSDSIYMKTILKQKGRYIVTDKNENYQLSQYKKIGSSKDLIVYTLEIK